MKRCIALIWLLGCQTLLFASTDMIANIQSPVQTRFGTYMNYPINGKPQVRPYSVEPDFSNVGNFAALKTFFSEKELLLLRKNLFVTTLRGLSNSRQTTGYSGIYDLYNEARERGMPILVTSDALLHTFHLMFDRILKTTEEKRFYGDLHVLLTHLILANKSQAQQARSVPAQLALERNRQFLSVALSLLEDTNAANLTDPVVQQELILIREPSSISRISPLFLYEEDYSQYRPRGHYTRSDSLVNYFRAMAWLGRMTFPIDADWSLSGILLLTSLAKLTTNGEPAWTIWERIYNPTVFLAGRSDDIDLYAHDNIIRQIYGPEYARLAPDELANSAQLGELMARIRLLPELKIGAGPNQPKGLRFMGQRFIPDSWIFDQLVYNQIPCRFWPTGLDVMAVLGSDRAYELLQKDYQEFNRCPSYQARLDSLRQEFNNYSPTVWAQNLYWNWLYCLMPLLMNKAGGWPAFMQSQAWQDRDLSAALGSWAELRHDTILYARQSGTEKSLPDASQSQQGYVEPNAYLYARLAGLASYLLAGLAEHQLLLPDINYFLTDMRDLLLSLKEISEKEWLNAELSVQDNDLISNIGVRLQSLATLTPMSMTDNTALTAESMPVIADIHTEYNTEVLKVGVGYPYSIFVVVPIAGQLKLVQGAGFSYYEFKNADRRTGAQWRDLLVSDSAPAMPEWTQSFAATESTPNRKPASYRWTKKGLAALAVAMNSDTARIGELIQVYIQAYRDQPDNTIAFAQPPQISLLRPNGRMESNFQPLAINPGYIVSFDTQGWESGHYWLETTAYLNNLPEAVTYRSGFYLTQTSGLAHTSPSPRTFALHQNHPNPFNQGTTITFDLPVASRIEIKVFNNLGQSVRKLINAYASAGTHTIQWDGNDDFGNKSSTGIYFCHFKASAKNTPGFENFIKMILIR